MVGAAGRRSPRCRAIAIAILVLLTNLAGRQATAVEDRVLEIGTEASPHRREVGGVVMQSIATDPEPTDPQPRTDPDLLLPGGVRGGRYQTLFHSHPAGNMPFCWHGGTEQDTAKVDAQIAEGMAAGLDPAKVHLQLLWISPCQIVPGDTDDELLLTPPIEPARAQYPSAAAAAIVTNPEGVKEQQKFFMRHAIQRWGIRTFTVWNEPEGLYPLATELYLEYYRLVHEALTELEAQYGDLQIGGPVAASAFGSRIYVNRLLDYVINNRLTIDRVVFHRYASLDRIPATERTREEVALVRGFIQQRTAAALQAGVPWPPEVQINEWGFDPTARHPAARTGQGAAFAASQLATFADLGLASAEYYDAQDTKGTNCADPCESNTTQAIGYGLLDRDDRQRPAYHVFTWFHRLGDLRLRAEPDAQLLGAEQEWGAYAGRDAGGVVRVLLWNHDPESEGAHVRVRVQAPTGRWDTETLVAEARAGDLPEPGSGTDQPVIDLPPNTTVLLTLYGPQPDQRCVPPGCFTPGSRPPFAPPS